MSSAHGNYTLYQDGQLIVFLASGPWNGDGSRQCLAHLKQLIGKVEHEEFAMLIDTSRGEGFTPDCFEIWIQAIDEWYASGLRAGIRVDNRPDINYRVFSAPFDKILIPLIGLGYSKNIQQGVKVLHRKGYAGFENQLQSATKISNCSALGLPANFLEPSLL